MKHVAAMAEYVGSVLLCESKTNECAQFRIYFYIWILKGNPLFFCFLVGEELQACNLSIQGKAKKEYFVS